MSPKYNKSNSCHLNTQITISLAISSDPSIRVQKTQCVEWKIYQTLELQLYISAKSNKPSRKRENYKHLCRETKTQYSITIKCFLVQAYIHIK